MQLDLPQDRVDLLFIDIVCGDLFDTGQHLRLKRLGVLGLAPFDAAAEHHLPH